ncbi:MAG: Rieske (2Fe-2S) protein [Gemmatimonadaceae bacterium]|nr:Rieske (2Fe-2S) protein [Gemmatimonadaceae bacterium]
MRSQRALLPLHPNHDDQSRTRQTSRRTFVADVATAGMFAILAGCRSATGVPESDPAITDAVRVTSDAVLIDIARAPALQAYGGYVVIGEVNLIVIRLAADTFRAFTNICTHAGCGIFLFERARLICQCHGSQFDTTGAAVQGPATTALRTYPATIDRAAGVLRIDRFG